MNEYKCLYCELKITGHRRKFCCANHKTMYYKRHQNNLLKTLKVVIPEMFEDGYEWNENDNKTMSLYFKYKDLIQEYINCLLEEKKLIE